MEFLQPTSLEEAKILLRDKERIGILAGGTDLILSMRDKRISFDHLMDCKKIPELNQIVRSEAGLSIGAAVTCNEIVKSERIDGCYDILKQGASRLANITLRNRATMVGNICNASPGGDMIGPALVLGGVLIAVSAKGERQIPLKDFFTGPKRHVLEKDELVIRVEFPPRAGKGTYLKKQRIKGHDLAQVGVSAFWQEDGQLLLALTAVGPMPILLSDLGVFSKEALTENRQSIIDKAVSSAAPISDLRATKEYRLSMVEYMTGQAIDWLAQ